MTDSLRDLLESRPTADELDAGVEVEATERERIVARAVRAWCDLMIDRTGRNALLKYKPLTKGTLELAPAQTEPFDRLLRLRSVAVEELGAPGEGEVPARARTVYRKAQENFEERGIHTLYVACGLATWDTTGPWPPAAPVLMLGARLTPRGAALDGFDVQLTGEVELNPTLLHILRTEHATKVEPEDLYARFDGELDEEGELQDALEFVRTACAAVPGFTIEPRRVLANFAFAKLPMVRDLASMVETLAAHDVIAAVAGVPEARDALAERRAASQDAPMPDFDAVPPADEFLILDADSTQNAAIDRVLAGESLVVKGPPGTGKSQTISNLIASLAARGKTVLFVAEKRAAIEAVTKRLDSEELGSLVLDVHGGVGTRRHFAARIKGALEWVGSSETVDATNLHRTLVAARAELHDASDTLHDVREPWGVSLYAAFSEALASGEEALLRLTGAHLDAATSDALRQRCDEARELVELGGLGASLGQSPWRGSPIATEAEAQRAQALLVGVRQERMRAVRRRIADAAATGLTGATSLETLDRDADLLTRASELCARYGDATWDADLAATEAALRPGASGRVAHWWRMTTSGRYRAARRDLLARLRPEAEASVPPHEDAAALLALRDEWALASIGGAPRPHPDAAGYAADAAALRSDVVELQSLSGTPTLAALSLDALDTHLAALAADLPTLAKLPRIHALRVALDGAGFAPVLEWCAEQGGDRVTADGLERTLRGVWSRSVIDAVTLTDPRLARLSAERLDAARAQFAAADRKHVESTSSRVRRAVAAEAIRRRNEHPAESGLLERQASLKSRHKPVRELIDETMPVLLGLKPCWVMSPLMVSQLLPQRPVFDVVVFDEASQIMPQDAVAAISRGRQLVVAGDERQLPPTAFFASTSSEDLDEADAEPLDGLPPEDGGTRGYESILDALGPLLPWRQLGWHYRSRDERLISFSNAHIYGGTLTTFPGAWADPPIWHVLVPSDPARPTAKGSSPLEVERVVELVVRHAETRPRESLGVITMGIEHAGRIEARLLEVRRTRPDLAPFFDEALEERFFVKNLERVQGDERDAIILSIGYGKDERGQLPYRFGPLLSEGGERRLNVAVTRAKRRMTVVSSFAFEDMEAGRSTAKGVELLREYLRFASSGGAEVGAAAGALQHPLNPFELDVQRVLEARGLSLDPQHGASGYRIDFAVRHPTEPGRFSLALECDGATYHASPAARDRDRLRQEHLERLGWRFHRIWSTDWFHDAERAADAVMVAHERAVAAITAEELAAAQHVPPPAPAAPLEPAPIVPDVIIADLARGARPRIREGAKITDYSHAELVAIVRWVRSDGRLRTDDALAAELRALLGFRRRGSRIDAALAQAIGDA
ncbi:MAG: hypothetical protein JWM98_291 [Thermoleophilia bacterium]|nr:hypothetical protein [Thermoleophilia bacterium]